MATLRNIPVSFSSLRSLEQASSHDPDLIKGGLTPSLGGLVPSPGPVERPRQWDLATLAGGIAEITATRPAAGLTAASLLLRDAQGHGEPAAWIAAGDSLPYPLDLASGGIDLRALPIVRVAGLMDGARACEHLLRSGAFGLIVLDLGRADQGRLTLPAAAQVRLAALCRRHHALLLILARRREIVQPGPRPAPCPRMTTPGGVSGSGAPIPFPVRPTGNDVSRQNPPVASLALIRAEGTLRRTAFDRFVLDLRVVKDKRGGTTWKREEVFHGPDGLC